MIQPRSQWRRVRRLVIVYLLFCYLLCPFLLFYSFINHIFPPSPFITHHHPPSPTITLYHPPSPTITSILRDSSHRSILLPLLSSFDPLTYSLLSSFDSPRLRQVGGSQAVVEVPVPVLPLHGSRAQVPIMLLMLVMLVMLFMLFMLFILFFIH